MEIFRQPKKLSTQINKQLSELVVPAREKKASRSRFPSACEASGTLDVAEAGRRLTAAVKLLGLESALEGLSRLDQYPSTKVLEVTHYLGRTIRREVREVAKAALWSYPLSVEVLAAIRANSDSAKTDERIGANEVSTLSVKAQEAMTTLDVCEAKRRLEAVLQVLRGEDPSSVQAQAKAVMRFKKFGKDKAIVGTVTVNGETFDAMLPPALFGADRRRFEEFAISVGGRGATRDENLFLARILLEQEAKGSLNQAGREALEIYQTRHVRDGDPGSGVHIRVKKALDYWNRFPDEEPATALVVIPQDGRK